MTTVEQRRLTAVRRTDLLDAGAEESFDRLTALARRLTGAPLAFLTVVDDTRSYWLSAQGLGPGSPTQNGYEESFCQYVLAGDPLVLPDVTLDERTRANPSIEGMGVRAWAGFPVRTPDGEVLGSFCVIDTEVHAWTPADIALLEDLAAIASREVALRVATADAEASRREARAEADRAGLLARIGDLLSAGLDPVEVWPAITTLTVPAIGDFAYVLTVEPDGRLLPAAARHRDAARQEYLDDWLRTTPRAVGEPAGAGLVALTGQVQLLDSGLPNPGLSPAQQAVTEHLDVGSSLVAPVSARGEVVAVVTIGRETTSAPFSDGDRALVAALADRARLVVENALAHRDERALSETMQQALLPAGLPAPDGLDLAVHYRPAGRAQLVGGDWYDAFIDATGTTTLVIGDVAGHDIEAATTMGQLRTMVRMAAVQGKRGPARILAAVDAACVVLGQPVFATAVVARLTPVEAGWSLQWASAGHPAPILVARDGPVRVLRTAPGLPLGVDPVVRRTDHAAVLAPGDTLLLHTDGLIEAKAMDLDTGLARLVGVLTQARDADPEPLCDQLVERLLPAGGAEDDVALVVVRPR